MIAIWVQVVCLHRLYMLLILYGGLALLHDDTLMYTWTCARTWLCVCSWERVFFKANVVNARLKLDLARNWCFGTTKLGSGPAWQPPGQKEEHCMRRERTPLGNALLQQMTLVSQHHAATEESRSGCVFVGP